MNRRLRRSDRPRAPTFAAALAATVLLVGCAGPGDKQVREDLTRLHPGCELVDYGYSYGGFGDHVRLRVEYRCMRPPAIARDEMEYVRSADGWHLRPAVVARPIP